MLRQIPLIAIFLITLAFFIMSLAACAPYKPDSTKAGVCNELNSRMIFDGSTSNIQKAEIQEAQDPLVQRTYDRNCES
jgi:hypothetical protein